MARLGAGKYRQALASANKSALAAAPVANGEEGAVISLPARGHAAPQAPSAADVAALLKDLRIGRSDPFFLLQRSAPDIINAKDETGATPLHWFALRGEEANVRRAILLGATVDAVTGLRQTPLMWAIINGHTRIVECLLGNGADVCARDTLGASPLILSLQHGHTQLFLKLLDYGADPKQPDVRGCTVAHWAAYKGQVSILRALRALLGWHAMVVEDDEGYGPIHRAARGGSLECSEFLVEECGIDPRTRAGDARNNGVVVKHAGNTIGVGIGWCHPTTATVDRMSKKSDSRDGDSGDEARAQDVDASAGQQPAQIELPVTSSGGTSSGPSLGGGVLGRGPIRSTLGGIGAGASGSRRPAFNRGPAPAAEDLPVTVLGGEKDKQVPSAANAASSRPAAPAPASSAPGSASNGTSAGSPLDMAEDALRLMVSSFESGGEYAGKQDLIKAQRALVKYLRQNAELYASRDKSFLGKLEFAYRVHKLPRVYGRLYIPGAFVALLGWAFAYWAMKMNGLPSVVAPSSPLDTYSLEPSSSTMSVLSIALISIMAVLYVRLYFGGAGAMDPYGALGEDRWFRTSPLDVIRHPYADPRGYGADRFRPSGVGYLKEREGKLMEAFKQTRVQEYEKQLASSSSATALVVPGASKSVFANGDKTPLKANGEVDYEALVEQQMGGSSSSSSDTSTSTASGGEVTKAASADAAGTKNAEPSSFSVGAVKSSAEDDCSDLLRALDEQEASAITVTTSTGQDLGPLGRLFQDVRRATVAVRRAWGEFADIGLPGGPAALAHLSPQLQKAFLAASDVSETVNARICVSCGILKPLRAKHDSTTDRCYDRYDHFCIWLGSPISAHNFKLFLVFVALLFTASVFGLVYGWRYAKFLAYTGDFSAFASSASAIASISSAAATAEATAAPAAPVIGFWRILRYFLASSLSLTFYAAIVFVGAFYPGILLYKHLSLAAQNITLNEAKNMQRFTHFQTLRLMRVPAKLSSPPSASGAGDEELTPTFENPFDLKDKWRNIQDLLSPATLGRVSLTTVASRDRSYLDEGVSSMAGQMSVEIKRAREAVQEAIDELAIESASGAGAAASAEAIGALAALPGAGGSSGAVLPPSREQVAAVKFLNTKMQEFPVLMGMLMAGQIDTMQPDLKKLLAQLPEEVSIEVVRKRIMTMRATLIVKRAWDVMWAQTMAARGGHGHGGHGHGGHGHSGGGGGGSHGHSHGGEPCDGHGHGGGGAAPQPAPASAAGVGGGSHGHSHGGEPCDGHGHGGH